MNSATVNIHTQVSVRVPVFSSLGVYLGVELLGKLFIFVLGFCYWVFRMILWQVAHMFPYQPSFSCYCRPQKEFLPSIT